MLHSLIREIKLWGMNLDLETSSRMIAYVTYKGRVVAVAVVVVVVVVVVE